MYIDRPQLKAEARQAMRASKASPYLVAAIYTLLTALLGYLRDQTLRTDELYEAVSSGQADSFYFLARYAPEPLDTLVGILLYVMSAMLLAGFSLFALRVWRRRETSVGDLFDGFAVLLRVVALQLVSGFFICLWGLLLIVPGVIAALRYSQALFLLLDHPELGVMGSLRESKRLMRGRVGELFVLELSFLGWLLLVYLPNALHPLLYFFSLAVSIYVSPYLRVTLAGWYDKVLRQDGELCGPDAPGEGR